MAVWIIASALREVFASSEEAHLAREDRLRSFRPREGGDRRCPLSAI